MGLTGLVESIDNLDKSTGATRTISTRKDYIRQVKAAQNPTNPNSKYEYAYVMPSARILIKKKQWGSLKDEFKLLSEYLEQDIKKSGKQFDIQVALTRGLMAKSVASNKKKNAKILKKNTYDDYNKLLSDIEVVLYDLLTGPDVTQLERQIEELTKQDVTQRTPEIQKKIATLRGELFRLQKDSAVKMSGILAQNYTKEIVNNVIARLNNMLDYGKSPIHGRDANLREISQQLLNRGLEISYLGATKYDNTKQLIDEDVRNLIEIKGVNNITVNNTIEGNSSANITMAIPENIAFVYDGIVTNNTYVSGLTGEVVEITNNVVDKNIEKNISGLFRQGGRFVFEPMDTVYIWLSSSFPAFCDAGLSFIQKAMNVTGQTISMQLAYNAKEDKNNPIAFTPAYVKELEKAKNYKEQCFEGLIEAVSYTYDANSGSYQLTLNITNLTKYLSMSQVNIDPAAGTDLAQPTKSLIQVNDKGEAVFTNKIITTSANHLKPESSATWKNIKDPGPSLLKDALAGLTPQQCVQMIVCGVLEATTDKTNNEYYKYLTAITKGYNARLGNFQNLAATNNFIPTFINWYPKYPPEIDMPGAPLLITYSNEYLKTVSPYVKMINDFRLWDSQFTTVLEVCQSLAKAMMFEFYPDENGNLVYAPPRLNTRPYWKLTITKNISDEELGRELIIQDNTSLMQLTPYVEGVTEPIYDGEVEKAIIQNEIKLYEEKKIEFKNNLTLTKNELTNIESNNKLTTQKLNKAQSDLKNLQSAPPSPEKNAKIEQLNTNIGHYSRELIALSENKVKLQENVKNAEFNISESDKMIKDLKNRPINYIYEARYMTRDTTGGLKKKQDELKEYEKSLQVITAQENTGLGTQTNPDPVKIKEEMNKLIKEINEEIKQYSVFTLGSRAWVLDESMLISKTITEDGSSAVARVVVQPRQDYIDMFDPSQIFQAHVMDPSIWINYGYREQDIPAPFIRTSAAGVVYARAVQVYLNSNLINGNVTVIGDAKYHIGDTLYIPSNGLLFYITSVNHNYSPGNQFQTTLTLAYGHGLFENINHPFGLDSIGAFDAKEIEHIVSVEADLQTNVSTIERLKRSISSDGQKNEIDTARINQLKTENYLKVAEDNITVLKQLKGLFPSSFYSPEVDPANVETIKELKKKLVDIDPATINSQGDCDSEMKKWITNKDEIDKTIKQLTADIDGRKKKITEDTESLKKAEEKKTELKTKVEELKDQPVQRELTYQPKYPKYSHTN